MSPGRPGTSRPWTTWRLPPFSVDLTKQCYCALQPSTKASTRTTSSCSADVTVFRSGPALQTSSIFNVYRVGVTKPVSRTGCLNETFAPAAANSGG